MYAGLQNTATKMLAKFGRSVTLTKPGYTGDNQEFNPETGYVDEYPSYTDMRLYVEEGYCEYLGPIATVLKAVFAGINANWKDKFAIEQGDSVALVAADGLEPEQNDDLDGWTILAVEAVKPADTAVLYKCHVRKQ
jgi:hypothetical protein